MGTGNTRGFTLIEVMIVVAIIGILAAIGYPAYQDQVRKARRADGIAALTRAAQLEERWFTEKGVYTDDIDNIGGDVSDEGYYTIDVAIPSDTGCTVGSGSNAKFYCFEVTAAPKTKGGQNNDTACASFKLTNTGAKSVTGTSSSSDCW